MTPKYWMALAVLSFTLCLSVPCTADDHPGAAAGAAGSTAPAPTSPAAASNGQLSPAASSTPGTSAVKSAGSAPMVVNSGVTHLNTPAPVMSLGYSVHPERNAPPREERPRPRFGAGFSIGPGVGNDRKLPSIGIELGPLALTETVSLSFGGGILLSSDIPHGTLSYPPPHGDYTVQGSYYDESFMVYGVGGLQLTRGVALRAIAGVYDQKVTTIARSNASGWHYKLDSTDHYQLVKGIGLFFPPFVLDYDEARGAVGGLQFTF